MRIGVKIGPADNANGLRRAAQEAERAGFDSVWLSERIVVPLDRPHPYQPMVDPWVALAFVAAVTERVQLGTSVSQIATRPPVLMARELVTLDRLSNGRLIVGAGAGWVVEEFLATDVPFETRGGRLSEAIQLLRHLWATPEQRWSGKHFQIPAAGIVMPLTPGGPPIVAGAVNDAGFRRVARHCDGWISTGAPPDTVAASRAKIDALRERYGRGGRSLVYVQATPPDTVDAAKDLAKSYAGIADELIITYGDGVPDGFLARAGATRALLETAATLP